MTTTQTTKTQAIIDRHDSTMIHNLNRYPVALVRGLGPFVYDAEGREYLDLFAGFGGTILGHCHPDLVKAVTEQAGKLWHVGNLFHTEPQTILAQAIAAHGFGGLSFFGHCGADANEAAIKLARLHGKASPGPQGARHTLITTHHSFHGRYFGTMMATGQEKTRMGFEPLLEGFKHVPFNDLAAMAAAIDDHTAAIMVEPIQGEGGINVPSDDYLPGLRKLCDQHHLLLIFDEVWTGCGRTGRYFAYQHWNVQPDIMTLAKGVGGGMAVSVMCAKPQAAALFDPAINHGTVAHATTLGGNCIAMAVAAAVFRVIQRDNLLDRAQELGQHAIDRLRKFAAERCPVIREVRGKGLFLGIELDPKAKGAPGSCWFTTGKQVVDRALERGVMINATQDVVIRLAPPINITREQLDCGLDVLEKVLLGQ